ncbi:MAG: hypothetical protein D3920_00870 [Candidatus Electrothrix sp. AW2]|nr:hypothetical protein [Candidatus Electrothrix gigas]
MVYVLIIVVQNLRQHLLTAYLTKIQNGMIPVPINANVPIIKGRKITTLRPVQMKVFALIPMTMVYQTVAMVILTVSTQMETENITAVIKHLVRIPMMMVPLIPVTPAQIIPMLNNLKLFSIQLIQTSVLLHNLFL